VVTGRGEQQDWTAEMWVLRVALAKMQVLGKEETGSWPLRMPGQVMMLRAWG
jgi:hypothetical protein